MKNWPLPPPKLVVTWIALTLLGGVSFGLSFIRFGAASTAASLTIAAIMAGIIAVGFIKIQDAAPLAWVFAGAGLFWLLILFGLSATDYGWRPWPGTGSAPSLRIHVPRYWEPITGTER